VATQILADGTGAADSADLPVSTGATLLVSMKDWTSRSSITISLKDDAGNYQPIGQLTPQKPAAVLSAGVYRFTRPADSASCGAFSA